MIDRSKLCYYSDRIWMSTLIVYSWDKLHWCVNENLQMVTSFHCCCCCCCLYVIDGDLNINDFFCLRPQFSHFETGQQWVITWCWDISHLYLFIYVLAQGFDREIDEYLRFRMKISFQMFFFVYSCKTWFFNPLRNIPRFVQSSLDFMLSLSSLDVEYHTSILFHDSSL